MDLRKSLTIVGGAEDKSKPAPSLSGALRRASAGNNIPVPHRPDSKAVAVTKKTGFLGYIVDATGSRQETWDAAQKIMKKEFSALTSQGDLRLRLVHFGGDEVTAHEWVDNPSITADAMGTVHCVVGITRFIDSFRLFLDDRQKASTIVMVGDSFEEDIAVMLAVARQLYQQGIKVFAFHEGYDQAAESVFRQIAEITGGKFAKFGTDIKLAGLSRAAAAYAIGGQSALNQLAAGGDRAAAALLGEGPLRLTTNKGPRNG